MITDQSIVAGSYRRLTSIKECRPELQALHAVWLRLRGSRTMPARRDFDPAEVPRLLPHVFLVDVFAGNPLEKRYRIRLQGTAQVSYHGADWTGSYVHQMTDPEAADQLCAVGDHVVASRAPWMSAGHLYWMPEKPFYDFESVLLPLSDDDVMVNMILGLTIVV